MSSSARASRGHDQRRSRARRGEGDRLRDEILQAARDLLAETGDESSVSVRAVAQRVGVTTPSIYLHFADKRALMDAVCVSVFAALEAGMEAAAAQAEGPLDALRRRGRAFVEFGLANPEHYRIVFMTRPADGTDDATEPIAFAAFQHFADAVQDCIDAGILVEDDPTPVALAMVAAAHGVTSLLVAKPHYPWSSPETMIDMAIETTGLGAVAHGRVTGVPLDEIPARLDRAAAPLAPGEGSERLAPPIPLRSTRNAAG